MNIVIGLFIIISALGLKHFYKINSKNSQMIFRMCIALGVFMFFSVQTFGNALLVAMTVAEVLLSVLLLAVYRAQLVRECAAAERRKAVRRQRQSAAAIQEQQRAAVRAKHSIPRVAYKPYAA